MKAGPPPPLDIRPMRGHAEMEQCVELQRTTWGAAFDQLVPTAILLAAQRTGGVASGAFDAAGRMLGFVFGISGVDDEGRLVHWSDMLAVHPDARGIGLGIQLKRHQRELLLARGVERVYWTFEPLEARNAHINFGRLGVIAREYLRDVYGETGSHLHAGIGTDRLVVEWHIASDRVRRRMEAAAEVTDDDRATGSDDPHVRIEVPADIQRLKRVAPDDAIALRKVTRDAFEHYLGRGWIVVDAVRSPDGLQYWLAPPGSSVD